MFLFVSQAGEDPGIERLPVHRAERIRSGDDFGARGRLGDDRLGSGDPLLRGDHIAHPFLHHSLPLFPIPAQDPRHPPHLLVARPHCPQHGSQNRVQHQEVCCNSATRSSD